MSTRSRLLLLSLVVVVVVVHTTTAGSLSAVISGRVGRRPPEEAEARQLVTEVVVKSLVGCSLLFLHDTHHILSPLPRPVLQHALGFSLVDLLTLDATTALRLKNTVEESDARVCRSVVTVAREDTMRRVLEEGAEAWAGHTKTFLLIMTENDPTSSVTSILLHKAFRYGAQVVAAVREKGGVWSLHTTNLYTGPSRQSTTLLDVWQPTTGFSHGTRLFPKDKMDDLQGYDFSVAALPYSPFIMDANTSLPGPGKYRGLEVLLLDVLAEAANFTYHYVAPADTQWGRLTANGTWTGMIGMVVYERADWAVSDITFSPERERYVDFCHPIIYDASELVTPRAKPLPRWLSPVRPFRWEVWAAVATAVALAGPFLCMVARNCYGSRRPWTIWFHQLGNAVLFIIEPMFQRGSRMDIIEVPGRVFSGFWFIFTMIVGISYSSSLTSFLIRPGLEKPIQDLRELVTSDIGWGKVYFGGVQSSLLEQAQDPTLIALREGVQWRSSLEGILQDVAKGSFATWDNSITTRLLVALRFTDTSGQPLVHFPGFELLQERIAWPMQTHAPYKPRFDQLISRVVQGGMVEKWLQFIIFEEQNLHRKAAAAGGEEGDAWKVKETTDGEGGGEGGGGGGQVVLTMEHLQGPFFVLLLGCLAGGISLLIEVFYRHILYAGQKV
ncbi:glutamate receptor ionotropic, delta-2-like [Panulirus ornatus]|uniref:glutamate receptor ionotropic, delta-2-like n=1 Tax=Panulirus ornatus TaxID=150431 RepID=UPI003A893BD6